MKKTGFILMTTALMMLLVSCEKVSPIGVLVSGTGVEDRIKMSHMYYSQHKDEYHMLIVDDLGDYTFLVGADSHLTTDDGRMREMLQSGLDNDDLLYAHLGDIADTKAEYYIKLENLIDEYRWKYAKKKYVEVYFGDDEYSRDDPDYYVYVDTAAEKTFSVRNVPLPFYPVVGNHDITHNGWALWSNIFHSSFYDVFVIVSTDPLLFDHFIFLDTANGTLGTEQVKLIEKGVLDGKELATQIGQEGSVFRHTFVFSHTNLFRPSSLQFASTFAREETFYLLKQFDEWNADIVFMGHVHKWDEQKNGDTVYLTLDSMCEANSPDPGDYLVRVHVKKDGTISWERVKMNYTAKK